MPSKMKSRPQVYPRLAFHLVRAIAFVSAAVVTGILVYFCIQLKHDGFKLPWTFIIILVATLFSLLSLLVSAMVYACAFLSPLFMLTVNISVAIIWTVGLALLTWNMYGTLGHSCSRSNWASDDGMMVCRTYKALYSFALFGWLAQVALIVLDIRSRRAQTALGRYNKMMLANDARDGVGRDALKMDTLGDNMSTPSHSHSNSEENVPYGVPNYHRGNDSPSRPLRAPAQNPLVRGGAADDYYGNQSGRTFGVDDFNNPQTGYDRRFQPQTDHSNYGYGYGPQR